MRAIGRFVARLGVCALLLVAGCTFSVGVTNSPPTPDRCDPGRGNC